MARWKKTGPLLEYSKARLKRVQLDRISMPVMLVDESDW